MTSGIPGRITMVIVTFGKCYYDQWYPRADNNGHSNIWEMDRAGTMLSAGDNNGHSNIWEMDRAGTMLNQCEDL